MALVWKFLICALVLAHSEYVVASCERYHVKSFDAGDHEYMYEYNVQELKTLYSYVECYNVNLFAETKLSILESNPFHDYAIGNEPPKNIKYILFTHSKIPLVPIGVFNTYQTLLYLYLNSSGIESIHPGAFTGLTNLEELQLGDNQITEIPRGTLNSLTNLITLNMSKNHVAKIEDNALLGLSHLKNLFLDNNKLQYLPLHGFQGLKLLQILDLSHNSITNITEILFSDISSVINVGKETYKYLDLNLSFNNLTTLNFSILPDIFHSLKLGNNKIESLTNVEHLVYLDKLDLSNNNLFNVTYVNDRLDYLNLSSNKIHELSNSVFNNSIYLNILDLSSNLITELHEDIFIGLIRLNELYLQKNQLFSIPIGCFRKLHSLTLLSIAGNGITKLEYGTFSGLSNLQTLDISNNLLHTFDEGMFHTFVSLQVLNINNNLLTSFDPTNLLVYTKHLKSVLLHDNPWSCQFLLKILMAFQSSHHQVIIPKGSSDKKVNVNGISCTNYKYDTSSSSVVPSDSSRLDEFFGPDFYNTSFYQFFQNFTNEQAFKDRLKNSADFFKQFKQIIADLKALQNGFQETFTQSEKLARGLSKYFDDDFKNSTFYKYFGKEFKTSDFFRYIDNNSKDGLDSNLVNIVTHVQYLKHFFNEDFRNSSFYEFFNQNYLDRYNLTNELHLEPIPAKYADHSNVKQNDLVFEKLTSFQNSISALLIIVIILMLGSIVFFAMKNRSNLLQRMRKSNSENIESLSESRRELELM